LIDLAGTAQSYDRADNHQQPKKPERKAARPEVCAVAHRQRLLQRPEDRTPPKGGNMADHQSEPEQPEPDKSRSTNEVTPISSKRVGHE
jgi:hypothetical protein